MPARYTAAALPDQNDIHAPGEIATCAICTVAICLHLLSRHALSRFVGTWRQSGAIVEQKCRAKHLSMS
jgi:hypothetical protein